MGKSFQLGGLSDASKKPEVPGFSPELGTVEAWQGCSPSWFSKFLPNHWAPGTSIFFDTFFAHPPTPCVWLRMGQHSGWWGCETLGHRIFCLAAWNQEKSINQSINQSKVENQVHYSTLIRCTSPKDTNSTAIGATGLAIEVVHGCLRVLELLEDDHGAGSGLPFLAKFRNSESPKVNE